MPSAAAAAAAIHCCSCCYSRCSQQFAEAGRRPCRRRRCSRRRACRPLHAHPHVSGHHAAARGRGPRPGRRHCVSHVPLPPPWPPAAPEAQLPCRTCHCTGCQAPQPAATAALLAATQSMQPGRPPHLGWPRGALEEGCAGPGPREVPVLPRPGPAAVPAWAPLLAMRKAPLWSNPKSRTGRRVPGSLGSQRRAQEGVREPRLAPELQEGFEAPPGSCCCSRRTAYKPQPRCCVS